MSKDVIHQLRVVLSPPMPIWHQTRCSCTETFRGNGDGRTVADRGEVRFFAQHLAKAAQPRSKNRFLGLEAAGFDWLCRQKPAWGAQAGTALVQTRTAICDEQIIGGILSFGCPAAHFG